MSVIAICSEVVLCEVQPSFTIMNVNQRFTARSLVWDCQSLLASAYRVSRTSTNSGDHTSDSLTNFASVLVGAVHLNRQAPLLIVLSPSPSNVLFGKGLLSTNLFAIFDAPEYRQLI